MYVTGNREETQGVEEYQEQEPNHRPGDGDAGGAAVLEEVRHQGTSNVVCGYNCGINY